jgi:VanZ family protein
VNAILRSRRFRVVRVVVWSVLLVAWTKALLTPLPNGAVEAVGGEGPAFWFGKSLHVGVYAILTLLTIALPFPRRWRIGLIVMLVMHGGATEYLQQFVQRHNSWFDVGRDTLGCLIGTALGWRWLRRRGDPFGNPPQGDPQYNARREYNDADDL